MIRSARPLRAPLIDTAPAARLLGDLPRGWSERERSERNWHGKPAPGEFAALDLIAVGTATMARWPLSRKGRGKRDYSFNWSVCADDSGECIAAVNGSGRSSTAAS